MFQKPTFGSTTTSTFGSFNAGTSASSPFGGFKPTTGTSAFGAPPAFGAAASTQPATGGGLFGASNTSGGLFGGTAASTSTPAFGSTTGGFGFGSTAPTTGFGGGVSTGLFGNAQNTSAFGAKPAGFGFGSTPAASAPSGGLFGATPSAGTGLFGQQNNSMTGGGLFSTTTGGAFGQASAPGTAHVKYSPVVGTDVVVKGGNSQNINIKHHCITCMKEYENKSLEELRLEDYTAGRKGAAAGGMFGGGFAAQTQEAKPLFSGSTFGQPATTTVASVFGGSSLGTTSGFGQTNTFSFGGNTQNTANTSLFGANKPAFGATGTTGTGLFGATTTTQAPSFGTSTSSTFGFGTNTQNQSGGLFGAKPATSGFGTTPSTSFGGFGTGGGLFQAKPQQPAPAFGATQPAFGNLSGGFGTATSTAGGGLFGQNSSFGKPAAPAPAFGFSQPTIGTNLGGSLTNNQAKPAVGGFGTLGGGGGLFQQPQQNSMFQTNTGFNSGGMFGGSTSLGAPSLSLGLNTNNTSLNTSGLTGASAAGNVHEQMLTLAARPYGDSPLFKDLVPSESTTAEEALKPTNPAAVKAVLAGGRLPPSRPPLRLQLRPLPTDKKSLFDGLEESDASLEDKLSLKPSRKRLVLRPNSISQQEHDRSQGNRSAEETRDSAPGPPAEAEQQTDVPDSADKGRHSTNYNDNNAENNEDKNNSWLSSSKLPWNDKEKPVEGELTPRLYPSLDKEIQSQTSDRRASWLTTKPLRKPLITNPDSAENSVRELGLRSPDRLSDKENIDTLSVSEEENVSPREMPPHPAGVKLTRPGYYTIPSLTEMIEYMRPDGSCVVPHLTIGRHNYGNVFYDTEIDVAGLDLDALVHFLNKEVIVYPEDADKPPVGSGLNRRAIVTLDRVWPRDKTQKRPITDPERLLKMEYEARLRRVCDKHDTKFIEYRPQTGSWVFRVEHFSKYGLTDSDEEDDGPTPEVLKRQLVNQSLQKAAPITAPKPPAAPSPGLGGLGLPGLAEDSLFAMHQTSLNLLNGTSKAFEMDTTEDNAEAQSLYQDNRAFGVKSPTSELARLENRQSHHVQLMKASLYADADMEDDISVSTGDQLVPISVPLVGSTRAPSVKSIEPESMDESAPLVAEVTEQPMRPLIVQPHTIVLKYHRKIPPFKETIAGRLGASYLADMSICRARHSRVGFGPGNTMAFGTSRDSVIHLPNSAQLCDLGKYVQGRSPDDWSEAVVTTLAIAQGDSGNYLQEALSRHLETLLEFSELCLGVDGCPALTVRDTPTDRRRLLKGHLRDATALQANHDRWGVSSAYCLEVWKLCDALWGDDLDNDGLPGTDAASIVGRYRKFLSWITDAVADITDKELAKPAKGEAEDEEDGHSSRIWTLLLGGRLLAACKLARQNNDLNMAALLAQASGDPTFRSLISRQLSLWRECGADTLIASHRFEALRLVAGEAQPLGKLLGVDWMRALHATARYLCPQVPSLERVVSTYEGFFRSSDDDEETVDILAGDEMGMQPPLPPYMDQYQLQENGKQRRVLDLRYELIRARANNSRPKLRPASYSPDPLDYSLCFLLGTWFGSPTVDSVTGVASQLEACGLWHLAVQALLYHPDVIQRGHLVRGVLSRHAPAITNTPELKARLQLIKKLQVPDKWLLQAQAYRAKYERLPAVEAELLAGAGLYNAAHRILIDEIMPTAVLSDDMKSIAPLLEQLHEAASRDEVSDWESGGLALYHYMHVCEEIRGLVSWAETEGQARGAVGARVGELRPRVVAACRALAALPTRCSRSAAARAEMGGRLLQLLVAGGASPATLGALLNELKLPPGAACPALRQITTELAEQASDSCIESVSSSPRSSHHRAAVHS